MSSWVDTTALLHVLICACVCTCVREPFFFSTFPHLQGRASFLKFKQSVRNGNEVAQQPFTSMFQNNRPNNAFIDLPM